MSLLTVLVYRVGDRGAIERIAADPWAVWVGLAFLLSTGLARGYDTRDLLGQPWHLALPLAASLVLSSFLFGALYIILLAKGAGPPPLLPGYRSLLALFLMTAPRACL